MNPFRKAARFIKRTTIKSKTIEDAIIFNEYGEWIRIAKPPHSVNAVLKLIYYIANRIRSRIREAFVISYSKDEKLHDLYNIKLMIVFSGILSSLDLEKIEEEFYRKKRELVFIKVVTKAVNLNASTHLFLDLDIIGKSKTKVSPIKLYLPPFSLSNFEIPIKIEDVIRKLIKSVDSNSIVSNVKIAKYDNGIYISIRGIREEKLKSEKLKKALAFLGNINSLNIVGSGKGFEIEAEIGDINKYLLLPLIWEDLELK
jgi:hypothetical protein